MAKHMLSTTDNPFDPFVRFDEWYAYDEEMGYHSCAFLARIARSSEELSEADQDVAVENAIDEIVFENILGIYKKVTQKSLVSES